MAQSKPYIGMYFRCCKVYRRLFLNHNGTAYYGHCPRCARPVTLRIDPQGAPGQFWEIS